MLLTISGDELCGLVPAYFKQQHFIHWLLALLPFQFLFNENSCGDQLIAPPPLLWYAPVFLPLCCVLVFSLSFIQFFFGGGGQSA
jgi:hypothetical protein